MDGEETWLCWVPASLILTARSPYWDVGGVSPFVDNSRLNMFSSCQQ